MVVREDNFMTPKGIIDEKLKEFTSNEWMTYAICEELISYMNHNEVVISVDKENNELCFGRLKEE